MKLNFRKVASVIASAVMLGSSLGIAAAANYPTPFIQSGVANVGVVVGSNAAYSDWSAALELGQNLQYELARQTAGSGSSSGGGSISGGDSVHVEKSTDKFNLGDSANTFYATIDKSELSTVLADGTYTNDDNNDYDFTQKITTGSGLTLSYFHDSDFNNDEPMIGFNLASGTPILNYTLDFTDAAQGGSGLTKLETTDLTLLGKKYFIVDATNSSATNHKLTLLDAANSAIIVEGTPGTVTVGNTTYKIDINYISSTETILTVNGVQTNKLSQGGIFKVSGDTYVAVKSILFNSKDTGVSKVEVSIGSGKIVLENNKEVEINNEVVSKGIASVLNSYLTFDGNDLEKITLEWTLDDKAWIAPGTDLVMPGFGTIKISMAGFNIPGKEVTKVEPDGSDKFKLSTVVKDGDVTLPLLYANATNIIGLGQSTTKNLVTSTSNSISFATATDEYFVISRVSGKDAESYVLGVTTVDDSTPSKNTTTIKNFATGDTRDVNIGDTLDFGSIQLKLNSAVKSPAKVVNVSISAIGGGTVSMRNLYTKDGMRITLPVSSASATGDGILNFSNAPTSHVLNFTEEDKDGTINAGKSFTASLGLTSGDTTVTSTSVTEIETSDGSKIYEGYVVSDLATKTIRDTGGDQDDIEIDYPGEQSYADVYIAESGAMVSFVNGTVVSGNGGTVTPLGSVTVSDAEYSKVSSNNVIVVGGSCINSVAAKLLGGSLCGAAFTNSTGVEAGQFVVQSFNNPDSTGKVALLVAGYEAADTSNAVKYLTTQKPDTTVGKKWKGTAANSATLVTS